MYFSFRKPLIIIILCGAKKVFQAIRNIRQTCRNIRRYIIENIKVVLNLIVAIFKCIAQVLLDIINCISKTIGFIITSVNYTIYFITHCPDLLGLFYTETINFFAGLKSEGVDKVKHPAEPEIKIEIEPTFEYEQKNDDDDDDVKCDKDDNEDDDDDDDDDCKPPERPKPPLIRTPLSMSQTYELLCGWFKRLKHKDKKYKNTQTKRKPKKSQITCINEKQAKKCMFTATKNTTTRKKNNIFQRY